MDTQDAADVVLYETWESEERDDADRAGGRRAANTSFGDFLFWLPTSPNLSSLPTFDPTVRDERPRCSHRRSGCDPPGGLGGPRQGGSCAAS